MTSFAGAAAVALAWSATLRAADPVIEGLVPSPYATLVGVGCSVCLSVLIGKRARATPGGCANALAGWVLGAGLVAVATGEGTEPDLSGLMVRVVDAGLVAQAVLAAAAPTWSSPGVVARVLIVGATIHAGMVAALLLLQAPPLEGWPAALGVVTVAGAGTMSAALAVAAPPPDRVGSRVAALAAGALVALPMYPVFWQLVAIDLVVLPSAWASSFPRQLAGWALSTACAAGVAAELRLRIAAERRSRRGNPVGAGGAVPP